MPMRSPEQLQLAEILHAAAESGDLLALQNALSAGADVNSILGYNRADGSIYDTPLSVAALAGHTAVVQALREAGADLEYAILHSSALTKAAAEGRTATVQALIAAGADVNAASYEGTAVIAAARHGHADIVKVLVAAGADVGTRWHCLQGTRTQESAIGAASLLGYLDSLEAMVPSCNTACLRDGLIWAAENYREDIAVVLLRELAARGEADAVEYVEGWLQYFESGTPHSIAFLYCAVLTAWAASTSEVDAQQAALARQQRELAAVACRLPYAVVCLQGPSPARPSSVDAAAPSTPPKGQQQQGGAEERPVSEMSNEELRQELVAARAELAQLKTAQLPASADKAPKLRPQEVQELRAKVQELFEQRRETDARYKALKVTVQEISSYLQSAGVKPQG